MLAEMRGPAATVRRLAAYETALAERLNAGLQAIADGIMADARVRILRQRAAARPLPSILADSLFTAATADGVFVGAAAPHAAFVEFGTARQPARPFLLPAALAARDASRVVLSKI
ncbi:MAG: hypothetical protein D6782_08540 [Alphaproteobacteria bacterium]|nr:MAG: hypothetical protein D6782_08540 [Alphaproteobacteria bacterium]